MQRIRRLRHQQQRLAGLQRLPRFGEADRARRNELAISGIFFVDQRADVGELGLHRIEFAAQSRRLDRFARGEGAQQILVDQVGFGGEILFLTYRFGHLGGLGGAARRGLQHRAARGGSDCILRGAEYAVLDLRLCRRVGGGVHQGEGRVHVGRKNAAIGRHLLPVKRRQPDGAAARRALFVQPPQDCDRLRRGGFGLEGLVLPQQGQGQIFIGARSVDMRVTDAAPQDRERLPVIGFGGAVARAAAVAAHQRRADIVVGDGGQRMVLAQQAATDGERLAAHLGLFGVAPETAERRPEAEIGPGGFGIILPEFGAKDGERLAHERFGAFALAAVAQIVAEVDQRRSVGGTIGAGDARVNVERALIHRLGLGIAALLVQVMRDISV